MIGVQRQHFFKVSKGRLQILAVKGPITDIKQHFLVVRVIFFHLVENRKAGGKSLALADFFGAHQITFLLRDLIDILESLMKRLLRQGFGKPAHGIGQAIVRQPESAVQGDRLAEGSLGRFELHLVQVSLAPEIIFIGFEVGRSDLGDLAAGGQDLRLILPQALASRFRQQVDQPGNLFLPLILGFAGKDVFPAAGIEHFQIHGV